MNRLRQSRVSSFLFLLVGYVTCAQLSGALAGAQQNSVHPQPRADQLPSPTPATANQSRRVTQPEGTLPTVPAGFSVASYAEMRGPRVMVYAPNGDLFVSSPSTNSIFVLRDANNDGVFESRGVFADGTTAPPPPSAPPPATTAGRPAPVLGVLEGPQSLIPNPPACTPPPDYQHRGPGGLRLPFGLAFNGGYLYVANTDSIVRFEYRTGDLVARGAPERLLDLPTGGHSTRHIVFNRAGTKMYIAVARRRTATPGRIAAARPFWKQTLTAQALASSPRAFAIPSDLRCSQARMCCGRQPTNETTWATIWCPTTRHR